MSKKAKKTKPKNEILLMSPSRIKANQLKRRKANKQKVI